MSYPDPHRAPSKVDFRRVIGVLWWIGLALVVLSWLKAVPPVAGYVGMGLTVLGAVGGLFRKG